MDESKQKIFENILQQILDLDAYDEFMEYMNQNKQKKDVLSHFNWLECI